MKTKFRNDLILIVGIALVALIFALSGLLREEGVTAEVSVNGEFYAELSLMEDTTLDVGGFCVIRVSGGKISFESSTCPNQLCVRHRPISRSGEAIVCLPNGVSVRINGDGPDFVI